MNLNTREFTFILNFAKLSTRKYIRLQGVRCNGGSGLAAVYFLGLLLIVDIIYLILPGVFRVVLSDPSLALTFVSFDIGSCCLFRDAIFPAFSGFPDFWVLQ